MTAAWAGICVSEPPCLMVTIDSARHTHDALLERKAFAVCVPSEKLVTETDYIGIIFDSGSKNYYGLGKGWNIGRPLIKKETCRGQ